MSNVGRMGNSTAQVDRWRRYRSVFWIGFIVFCAVFVRVWRVERAAMDAYDVHNAQVSEQRQAVVEGFRQQLKGLDGHPPPEIEQRLHLSPPLWTERSKSEAWLATNNVEKRYYVDKDSGAQFGIRFLEGGYYDIPDHVQPAADGVPWGWWIVELRQEETLAVWLLLVIYFFAFAWSRRVVAEVMLGMPVLYGLVCYCGHHPMGYDSIAILGMVGGSLTLLWLSYKSPYFNTRLCQTCGCDLSGVEAGAACPGCGLLPDGKNARFHEALKERVARGLEEDVSEADEGPADDEQEESALSAEPPVEPGESGERGKSEETAQGEELPE